MRHSIVVVCAALLCAAGAHASLFNQFVIFGDSLSDNGNVYIATGGAQPAPPLYTPGSFTDGPLTNPPGTAGGIWDVDLSALLGEPVAQPFLAGGTNYAVGGAQVLAPVSTPYGTIPSLEQQVGLYLTSTGGVANPNNLYILWGGANDLYSAVETPGATPADIAATETAAINSLAADIEALAAAGAKDFLWLNLPQLASTPRGAADPLNGALSTASTQFAANVTTQTALLQQLLGINIADVDVYGLYQSILADPSAYHYVNVTTPAQGLNVNPDQYLFWDLASHPTTTGHRLIALAAEDAVMTTFAPEPATCAFAALGLAFLLARRRRKTS